MAIKEAWAVCNSVRRAVRFRSHLVQHPFPRQRIRLVPVTVSRSRSASTIEGYLLRT